MKLGGILVAIIGALLFVWHLVKVMTGTDYGSLHLWLSFIGGVLLFIGIWLYTAGRGRARRASGEPIE